MQQVVLVEPGRFVLRDVAPPRPGDSEALVRPRVEKPRSDDAPPARLTARQQQVLTLIAEGKSMKHIAATLNISRRTVEAHKYKLMRELGVHNVAQLIQRAMTLRLISVPPRRP